MVTHKSLKHNHSNIICILIIAGYTITKQRAPKFALRDLAKCLGKHFCLKGFILQIEQPNSLLPTHKTASNLENQRVGKVQKQISKTLNNKTHRLNK